MMNGKEDVVMNKLGSKIINMIAENKEKAAEKFNKGYSAVSKFMAAIMVSLMMPCVAFAEEGGGGTLGTVATNMQNAIYSICQYAGGLMALCGAVMTIIAYKQDDSNGQTNGIRFLLVGAALFSLQALFSSILPA